MSASHLRPQPGALGDELVISAMARALRHLLSDFDLSDGRLRRFAYLNSGIEPSVACRLDAAALKVELIRRRAMGKTREFKEAAE